MQSCGLSPAELCMSRRLRDQMPVDRDSLKPSTYDHNAVRQKLEDNKMKQKHYHDKKAGKELPDLKTGEQVLMQSSKGSTHWIPAVVLRKLNKPRTYLVTCQGQEYRRNRKHLRQCTKAERVGNEPHHNDRAADGDNDSDANGYSELVEKHTRSGRLSKPPSRYGY